MRPDIEACDGRGEPELRLAEGQRGEEGEEPAAERQGHAKSERGQGDITGEQEDDAPDRGTDDNRDGQEDEQATDGGGYALAALEL